MSEEDQTQKPSADPQSAEGISHFKVSAEPHPSPTQAANGANLGEEAEPLNLPPSTELKLRDMLKNGVHFGHQTQRWNPKMKPFIFGERGGIHIIDLMQTIDLLEAAKHKAAEVARRGGIILFICTKRQGKEIVGKAAQECGMPYITKRWLGGFFTNFHTIYKRISYMNSVRAQRDAGELDKMIKKERAVLLDKLAKLEGVIGGVAKMRSLPDMILVIDPHREYTAIREAHAVGIPVMATLDTNCDPDVVDFIIPTNDDAIRAITYIMNELVDVIRVAREEYLKTAPPEAEEKPIGEQAPRVAAGEVKVEIPDEFKTEEDKELERTRDLGIQQAEANEKEADTLQGEGVSGQEDATQIKAHDIPGLTKTVVSKLEKAGYKTLSALRELTLETLEAIEGIGPATAKKIMKVVKAYKV
jgi:small subunit ribosomal protein S2